jgi:hypothetical protein
MRAAEGAAPEGSKMKTKYTAKAEDGREFTRNSVKTYTHAVIFTATNGYSFASFASSEELAQKAAAWHYAAPKAAKDAEQYRAERHANWTHEIVEVTA